MLNFVKLKPDSSDVPYFEETDEEAFPVSERMSMNEIFSFADKTRTDVLGIYDDGNPVGFTMILRNDDCGYVFFLAIGRNFRNKGYGSGALEKIRENYPGIQIVLDFEVLDPKAPNYTQRRHRKNFYLRNGFHETGHYTMLNGARFEVVCSEEHLNESGFKDLLQVIHSLIPEFSEMLF